MAIEYSDTVLPALEEGLVTVASTVKDTPPLTVWKTALPRDCDRTNTEASIGEY